MHSSLRSASRVWRALYLREAVTRLSVRRGAWFWVLAEPAEQVAYVAMLHFLIGRAMLPGVSMAWFIAVGVLPFMLVRNVTLRGMEGLDANRALMHYRQVKPFDTVFVRAVLEATLLLIVSLLLLGTWSLFAPLPSPADPLSIAFAALSMWMIGLGLALIMVTCKTIIPELVDIVRMAFGPLYMISGTMFPSVWIPHAWQKWLFVNPLIHGIELIRLGTLPHYRTAPYVSPMYLGTWALCLLTLGLALHIRFDTRIRSL